MSLRVRTFVLTSLTCGLLSHLFGGPPTSLLFERSFLGCGLEHLPECLSMRFAFRQIFSVAAHL